MTYEQREMSMRGNNIPFAHAIAFHEMIPGHFLQFYMGVRYHAYRQAFETPFWGEGDTLPNDYAFTILHSPLIEYNYVYYNRFSIPQQNYR
jgi:hypothetical protein